MSPIREQSIVDAIGRRLRKLKGCYFIKTHGGYYGVAGTPDLLGSYQGRCFAFEVKVPGNLPTPLQNVQMIKWRRAGAIVAVVHNVQEVLDALGVTND